MLKVFLTCMLSMIYTSAGWTFTCYFTLVKDSCWTEYNVAVDIIDVLTEKKILTVTVPKGKSWKRETFACNPKQNLMYHAQFNPVYWENDKGKVYHSLRSWFLPEKINPGDTAWTISVCFAADFAGLPLPPKNNGKCSCDFSLIPPIMPK